MPVAPKATHVLEDAGSSFLRLKGGEREREGKREKSANSPHMVDLSCRNLDGSEI